MKCKKDRNIHSKAWPLTDLITSGQVKSIAIYSWHCECVSIDHVWLDFIHYSLWGTARFIQSVFCFICILAKMSCEFSHVPVLTISSSAFLVKLINKQMRVKKLYMASAFIFAAIVSPLFIIIVANSTVHLYFQTVTQWCTWQQWFTWLVRSSLFHAITL